MRNAFIKSMFAPSRRGILATSVAAYANPRTHFPRIVALRRAVPCFQQGMSAEAVGKSKRDCQEET
jgi:hypothetical protein